MENFTLMDGILVTIVSILVVFSVLIGLLVVLQLFQFLPKDKQHQIDIQKPSNHQTSLVEDIEVNEETKLVAGIMALILANQDQQNKKYQITKIKRIR
ncbi:MAG: OadG family protein [Desemzia incerta]|uniref:OadG family protein n=1 Tax=Desemzia incerta TaxID=82801 RepID=UPI0033164B14